MCATKKIASPESHSAFALPNRSGSDSTDSHGVTKRGLLLKCRRTSLSAFVVVLSVAAIDSNAQTMLLDDFSDGEDGGWMRVDTTIGEPWGPGDFDASSGAYHLRGSGDVPEGEQGILVSLYEGSSAPLFNNGFLRANLRTTNDTLTYLVMRGDPATFTAYAFGGAADTGNFFWNKVVNNVIVEGESFTPDPPFTAGEEWVLEAGTVGTQLSMKAWRVGDPEPLLPQWTHTDTTIVQGLLGVGANHWAELAPSTVDATFDDVFFTVPEPSTCMLGWLGLVVTALHRRWLGSSKACGVW